MRQTALQTQTRWRSVLGYMFVLSLVMCLVSGAMIDIAAKPESEAGILLEEFLYYTTDDKIILDLLLDEPAPYTMRYLEVSNMIIVELPGVEGKSFYLDELVDDAVLDRISVGPLAEHDTGGVLVTLYLRHKVPEPLAFRVKGGRRLLVEAQKEFSEGFERFVAPGLAYGHWRKDTPSGPLFVNYMKIDLKEPGIRVSPVMATGGKETVDELVAKHGAIAGVNGIYFAADGRPLGLVVIDGELISPPYFNRTAAGMWPDGTILIDNLTMTGEVRALALDEPQTTDEFGLIGEGQDKVDTSSGNVWQIDGVNRLRYADELIVYTPENGLSTRTNNYGLEIIVENNQVVGVAEGNGPIPRDGFVLSGHGKAVQWLRNLEIGEYINASWGLQPDWLGQGVVHALGGGPRLLRGGKIDITAEEERFQPDITLGRAPRTALGTTADGKLVLVTVNGRQDNISIGMSLQELAELMQNLGAMEAMNLDGGGSSTMVVRGIVLNAPSDGRPRAVSNAVLVWADTK